MKFTKISCYNQLLLSNVFMDSGKTELISNCLQVVIAGNRLKMLVIARNSERQ